LNVLVIPEDFRKDQYILKPVIEAMLAACGRPNAKVRILTDPVMGGLPRAMDWEHLSPVIERYKGMTHVFVLIVDRDGDAGRREKLDRLETQAAAILTPARSFVAENAWQEVEVWALAGAQLPKDWGWTAVRSEQHPKERYFQPLAHARGLTDEPGGGRRTLGREAASNYRRVHSKCPEDVGRLEERIRAAVG